MSQPAESLKVYVPEKNPKVYMPEKSPKSERGTHKSQGNVGKTQGFESPELVRLFGIIDKLRECGVSEDISLPQVG